MEGNLSENSPVQSPSTPPSISVRFYDVIVTCVLLIGPFIMGITIVSLGYEDPIKVTFLEKYDKTSYENYKNCKEASFICMKNAVKNFPDTIFMAFSLFPLGGMFGSLSGAALVEKCGRKPSILIFAGSCIAGAIVKIISKFSHIALLAVGRFLDGFGAAGLMVAAVMMMFEITPSNLTPFCKGGIQLSCNLGIIFTQLLNMSIALGTVDKWIYIHAIQLVIGVFLFIFVVVFIKESPQYLLMKGEEDKAHKSLKTARGKHFDNEEFNYLKSKLNQSAGSSMTIKEFLSNPQFRWPTFVIILTHVCQQITGINAIVAFSTSLFKKQSFFGGDASLISPVTGAVCLLGSMIFMPISAKCPRKLSLVGCYVVMLICFVVLAATSNTNINGLLLALIIVYILAFQAAPGPMVWFMTVETFPADAAGPAQGVCSLANWLSNSIIFLTSPLFMESDIRFVIFSITCAFAIVVHLLFLRETKNRSPEEVIKCYQSKKVHVLA